MTSPIPMVDRRTALAALRAWVDAGVDDLVEPAPRDWLSAFEPSIITAPTRAETTVVPFAAPASTTVARARQLADTAHDLATLRAHVDQFEGCALKQSATHMVFADGAPESRVMLIGEAPGAEEDRRGLPFVGQAGQLLDRMLAAIGRDRTSAYITNILFWRPPGNRKPTDQEIDMCLPFVMRHIELVNPIALLCLGGTSAPALLNVKDGITRLRGHWHTLTVGDRTYPVLPTFHPAYLLRAPAQKAFAWRDLLDFKARIDA